MAKQIKPDVDEISLAFQPANLKKFLMRKDAANGDHETIVTMFQKIINTLKKGVGVMDKDQMVKELITNKAYPFTKEDQAYLEGLDEARLGELVKFKKEEVKDPEKKLDDEAKAELEKAFNKEHEEKLRKEIEAEVTEKMTEEKEGVDAAVTELKKEVVDLKKGIEDAGVKTQKEVDARRKVEYTTFIKEKNVPGDVDKMVATLVKLRESDKDAFESYKESLEEMGKTLSASGLFAEVGAQGDGDAGDSAYIKLQKEKVEVMKEDTNLSETEAWRRVIKDKAELYKEYMKERKAAVKTSNE